ncbi:hypothetical protein [Croceitalea rosinachiae]|uniref:LysM domain-containing protein n=1 Tax=Croceitalea rosinachiae TaxID=3075596 RepID=A0ABU3AA12_9FLAO|nr:hypothetical protein [Croceitalea sp. F388]MDT0606735.1 hypothetical protein [Croceitalea sp. F388]
MNRVFLAFLSILVVYLNGIAQDSLQTVIAQKGDGIFSVLRKEGLNPSKYYAEFVALNTENLRNGSELHLGRAYKIPNAPDSFKETGKAINIVNGVEEPLFSSELNKISVKSDKLNKAVYYLIAEDNNVNTAFGATIVSELARELLVNGAQVYLMESDTLLNKKHDFRRVQEYVETINKRYLKHTGKYQRLLIIRSTGEIKNRKLNVAIYHHSKSEEGQKFADNIKAVVKRNSITNRSVKDFSEIFENDNDLFLAKNVLPAISVIDVSADLKFKNEQFSVYSDKRTFAKWVTKGMFNDYAELDIEK